MFPPPPSHSVLLIAADTELRPDSRVWGTGGWMMPDEREALDWLILCRLLGWRVSVTHPGDADFAAVASQSFDWVILGCAPAMLSDEAATLLAMRLRDRPTLVIARCAAFGSRLAALSGVWQRSEQITGGRLRWEGPGPSCEWLLRAPMSSCGLGRAAGAAVWASLDGEPVAIATRLGRATLVTLGFHPSEARDSHGFATALLRRLLICGAQRPVAWYDFSNTLILRMDDPGGAQNLYSRDWCYPKLDETDWMGIAAALWQRRARLSIGYVSGWVDDGDPLRGELRVDGRPAPRIPGAVHPSPLVEYRDLRGHTPGTLHDYRSEFRGIARLRAIGLGDVELHGHTHMHPDTKAWTAATDRYEAVDAYRELGRAHFEAIQARPAELHPLRLGCEQLHRFFGIRPTTLICPGDQWTDAALEIALDLGIDFVGSYYLALRDGDRFCWATHICAPYLDEPAEQWFDSGLPVVGYFHDLDPAIKGIRWFADWLDQWAAVGARHMIDLREFSSAVMRPFELTNSGEGLHLQFDDSGAPNFVRTPRLKIFSPAGKLPSHLSVSIEGETSYWTVQNVSSAEAELVAIIRHPIVIGDR